MYYLSFGCLKCDHPFCNVSNVHSCENFIWQYGKTWHHVAQLNVLSTIAALGITLRPHQILDQLQCMVPN